MSLADRVRAALARRAPLQDDPATTAYRLINGAADGYPDLAIDRYGPVLVANLYTQGRRVEPPRRLLETVAVQAGARSVYVKYRPTQASVLDEAARRELAPREPLVGEAVEEVEILEAACAS
jgi:23S rRNA (cytosine1962-C5)-methyltransferase